MAREYDEADRQYFAGFIEERARMRPIDCHGGLDCWVEFGPPAMIHKSNTVCVGCGGTPKDYRRIQPGKPYTR